MAVNGNMADIYHKMKRQEKMLEERICEISKVEESKDQKAVEKAWEKAVREASKNSGEKFDSSKTTSSETFKDENGNEKPFGWNSLEAQRGTSTLRHRANSKTRIEEKSKENDDNDKQAQPHIIRDPHPLTTHPDSLISSLAKDIENAREELISNGDSSDEKNDKRIMWPENVTYWNFWDYLLVPTLCYELEYPRTDS